MYFPELPTHNLFIDEDNVEFGKQDNKECVVC